MNRSYRVCFIVVIMVFVFGFAGCKQDGPAEKAGKKIDNASETAGNKMEKTGEAISAKVDKTGEILDDTAITAKIKADILSDPLLKVSQINVTTTNNVVMLSGVADSQKWIDRAMEIARSVKNVKSVENKLAVK